jgi:2-polyprenyl-3-methyl-5-hydroxy-6-metoxy-1,4-benzoquinol methylase
MAYSMTPENDKIEVNRPCIVCGSGGIGCELYRPRFSPDVGYPGDFILHRCGCGLIYNSPRLDEAGLTALYDRNYYVFHERHADAFKRVVALYQRTITSLLSFAPERKVLEVGCARGHTLALMRGLGWKTSGIELSLFAAASAQQIFDLTVHQGTLEDFVAKRPGVSYPVVFSTDVIEHVPDPRGFLAALSKAVRPGGMLLLSTPNGDAEGIRRFGGQWLGYNNFHIWIFSRDTLARMLTEAGFEVVSAYSYDNGNPFSHPARSGAQRAFDHLPPLVRKGVHEALAAIRSGGDAWTHPVTRCLHEAIESASLLHAFSETQDGQHPDAPACRGENLVMIARRVLS